MKPPATAEEGAALIRAHTLKLFDQQDGQGANWRLMAESLFRVAFDALDRLPADACRKVAERVHAGAYERVTEGPKAAVPAGPGRAGPRSGPSSASNFDPQEPGSS